MKAIVQRRYGSADVLRCEDIGKPTVADDELLIKVRAASVNALDWRLMRGEPYLIRAVVGFLHPRSPRVGVDLAGEVEAVGKNVTQFRPGNAVFGAIERRGAFAEYACAGEKDVVAMPGNSTFELAAAVPVAALTALQGLRDKGRIKPGQNVLINGAAGGVGTFAVQIAKALGAHVTGVCSTKNVETVGSIGADDVIDYTRQDFASGTQRYDLVLDIAGSRSLSDCRRVMNADGTYVAIGGPAGGWIGPLAPILKTILASPFVSQTLVVGVTKQSRDDLIALKTLIEDGKVTPVIDRHYTLAEVPQAVAYVEEGHARGKVVIRVQ